MFHGGEQDLAAYRMAARVGNVHAIKCLEMRYPKVVQRLRRCKSGVGKGFNALMEGVQHSQPESVYHFTSVEVLQHDSELLKETDFLGHDALYRASLNVKRYGDPAGVLRKIELRLQEANAGHARDDCNKETFPEKPAGKPQGPLSSGELSLSVVH